MARQKPIIAPDDLRNFPKGEYYLHGTDSHKAVSLIERGVVSKNFADRAKIPFKQDFDGVSRWNTVSFFKTGDFAYLKRAIEKYSVILVASNVGRTFPGEWDDERVASVRVAPRKIIACITHSHITPGERAAIISAASKKGIPVYSVFSISGRVQHGRRLWP